MNPDMRAVVLAARQIAGNVAALRDALRMCDREDFDPLSWRDAYEEMRGATTAMLDATAELKVHRSVSEEVA